MARPRKSGPLLPLTATQELTLLRISRQRYYEFEVEELRTINALKRRGMIVIEGERARITERGREQVLAERTVRGPSYARRLKTTATDPLVRHMADLIDASGVTYRELTARAGVHPNTMQYWLRENRSPMVSNMTAVLNAIGKKLAIVDIDA